MYKCIHLLFATSLLGITILNYLLVILHKPGDILVLKKSLGIDYGVTAVIIILLLTGTRLVPEYHWSYHTPWIVAAYSLLLTFSVLWGISLWYKQRLKNNNSYAPLPLWFHGCQVLSIIILIVIAKDAVTKHTWF